MEREIIISPTFNPIEISGELQKLLKLKGYKGLNIKARTDKDVIDFIREYGGKNSYIDFRLKIENVDTSRPWTINEYDGSEYIQYLDEHKLVDKDLNYYELL